VARAIAIGELVSRLGLENPHTLDVGCGDAYLVRELLHAGKIGSAVGQDIHLTRGFVEAWSEASLRLVKELSELDGQRFELLLLLDVLEHVEDPATFLHALVRTHLERCGRVVITVPAFQSLFTRHDRDLKHFRRYARGEIANVATAAGLRVHDSGYLFGSLLLPRAMSALAERLRGPRIQDGIGVGQWQAPSVLTNLVTCALKLDNRLSLHAHDRGLVLPGLSSWLLCNLPS
jgi:hypothetical protein